MASKTKLDKNLLKGLEPLGNLAYDKLEELVSKATIEDLSAGRTLFREGEKDNRTLYLIQGQVEFRQSGEKKSRVIKSKNAQARQPLDNHQPHTGTAKAKGPVTVVSIDSALLEIILNDTPLDAYEFEVTELGGEDTTDWMLRFLQSRAFLKLPTDNIQAILMRMEELPAKKGERIIHQGEQDDYYYIVQSGRCSVTRRPAPKAGEIPLATLEEGDGFGEEALITNGRRNASISMLEDGILMRLKKADFLAYLAEPLITRLSESDTAAKLDNGALLIDVRSHEEFNRQHAEGSVNIPLSMLRLKLDGLNPDREYVLASADGTQSAAAAFLLTQHGFECGILDGGLQATSFKLTGSANQGEATTAAAPASKRTAAAEKTRQAAEDQARKLSQQADTARREAEQLAEKTASAEKAKRDAEQEIQRLSEQNQQAEKAARKQAEQVRHQAEAELQKIQAAKRANEEKQQALDASLKRAQQIAAEATEAAKRSREQAEKEAAAIRRQAREEAEQLKQEMEETRRRFEQQTSQAEQEKEAQRQAAIEQARQEANAIRQQAQSEAERLRSELETARQAVDQRAAEVEQQERQKQVSLLEKARSRAMELAEKTTRIAEQEAEEIRRKALEEAEQLRQEMEQTRQQVMEHAARAQQEAQARAKQDAEEQAHREAEEQAQREAKARAKQQAEEQAQREAEARAKQQAEEQARREAEARAKQAAEQKSKQDQEREARRQQAIRQAQHRRQEQARRMAEEIKAKLEQAEQQRQAEEERQRGEGLSLARATLQRKSDGRIILEGEEDIFIFKEPSVTPEQIEAELDNEPQRGTGGSSAELPSFEIEETEKPVFKPLNTQAVHARIAEQQASHQQKRKKRHVFALAASLMLALGSGGVYLFLHPELIDEHVIARTDTGKSTTTRAGVGTLNNKESKEKDNKDEQSRQTHENNLESNLRERFDNLLEQWKEIVSR